MILSRQKSHVKSRFFQCLSGFTHVTHVILQKKKSFQKMITTDTLYYIYSFQKLPCHVCCLPKNRIDKPFLRIFIRVTCRVLCVSSVLPTKVHTQQIKVKHNLILRTRQAVSLQLVGKQTYNLYQSIFSTQIIHYSLFILPYSFETTHRTMHDFSSHTTNESKTSYNLSGRQGCRPLHCSRRYVYCRGRLPRRPVT